MTELERYRHTILMLLRKSFNHNGILRASHERYIRAAHQDGLFTEEVAQQIASELSLTP